MNEEQQCGVDPYWLCASGLHCTSNVCRKATIPHLGACDALGSVCATGLTCAGGPPRRCIKFMNEGQRCGVDPYWLCAAGLSCISHVCRGDIPQWGVCDDPGSVCAARLTCGGGPPKKCIRLMTEGQQCGVDPYWLCVGGLHCISNVCRKTTIPHLGACDAPGSVCATGLICGGGPPKKCIKLMNEGERCGVDPYWICAGGLQCLSHVCRRYIPRLGVGDAPGSICATGLTCAGGPPKRCISFMAEGQRCGVDPYWLCQSGLHCLSNVCVRPVISEWGACDATRSICAHGLACGGGPPKRCIKPTPEGHTCGIQHYSVCTSGFQCILHVCRKPTSH